MSKKKGALKLVAASELPDLYLRASDNDVTAFPNQDHDQKTVELQHESQIDLLGNAKQRRRLMHRDSMKWYPESGDDIYDDQPGRPIFIDSGVESQSCKNTEDLAKEAQREKDEAEELFEQYEKECLAEEEAAFFER